ncbi:BMP family ABC transporter substrate-binding protein (plasmid) [Borrelia coriaceae]|uniref:Basic membrane protein C n=1 Tax=Borrelia coriaceae ATCC 43381 TaxID=1408429 RepID=W5SXG6_9SPIR|nr:BMP family ABC transporter substrate-binding protein [Borrelia coriaceae]AHH11605.1 Basic membrane protein C precursor [Borrelia coriaceae ATCC 43381]UPA17251.1 BMP family ABC transporter substrate-binding protein [Borrelia coriaceae]
MSRNLFFLFFLFFMSCFFTQVKEELAGDVFEHKIIMGIIAPGRFDDNGYFQNAFEGALELSNVFGIKLIPKVLTPYPIEDRKLITSDELLTEDVLALQNEGVNFIWFISSYFSDMAIRFAYENPHVFYAIVDDMGHNDMDKLPKNLVAFSFRVEEGAFLAGYIASKMSKKKKLGFVTGASIMRNVERFLVGFRAGAFYENPKTRVILRRVLEHTDESVGEDIAKYMYIEDGVDVIFPVMGPAVFGIFRIAKELGTGHYVIGVNKDQSHLAPGHFITSVIRNLGKAIYDCSSSAIQNHYLDSGGVIKEGIKEGIIDVIKDPNVIGDDLVNEIKMLQEQIVKGELVIPSTDYELDVFKDKIRTLRR